LCAWRNLEETLEETSACWRIQNYHMRMHRSKSDKLLKWTTFPLKRPQASQISPYYLLVISWWFMRIHTRLWMDVHLLLECLDYVREVDIGKWKFCWLL
jgi:hypothetical protein